MEKKKCYIIKYPFEKYKNIAFFNNICVYVITCVCDTIKNVSQKTSVSDKSVH